MGTSSLTFGFTFSKDTRAITGEQDRLRYSALDLWLKNKDQYRERYYKGASFMNREMVFGHVVHKDIENKKVILKELPMLPVAEYNIELEVAGVRVGGCLDAFDPETCSFLDYKSSHLTRTGEVPWDNIRVAKHMQLVFYSLLIKQRHKRVDPWTKLVWIETRWKPEMHQVGSRLLEGEGNSLELTGKFEVFNRRIPEWERTNLKKIIKREAKAISEDFKIWKLSTGYPQSVLQGVK